MYYHFFKCLFDAKKTKREEVTSPQALCPECSMVASPSTFHRPKRLANTWQLLTVDHDVQSSNILTCLTWPWHDIQNGMLLAELPIHGLAMTFAIEKLRCQVLRGSTHCPCREIVANASSKRGDVKSGTWNHVISSIDSLFGVILSWKLLEYFRAFWLVGSSA